MKMPMVLCIAAILSGCASNPFTEAYDRRDDAFCQQIGAMPGTQMYFDCRLARTHDRAIIQAGSATSGPDPILQNGFGAQGGFVGLPPTPQAGLGANGQSCLGNTIQTAYGPRFYCQ